MRNYDTPQETIPSDTPIDVDSAKKEQRRREVHQRLEDLNEERRLKRLIDDEWDE